MRADYEKWIEENVKGDGLGQCAQATIAMNKAFPRLKRVRGHFNCLAWGMREHWWLVDEDGTIVDPTSAQFPSTPHPAAYIEWNEGDEEPTGKCPNCGGYSYGGRYLCSDKCDTEYTAYINGEVSA